MRNDIDEQTLRHTFATWQLLSIEQAAIASDTRMMDALVTLLERE